MSLKTEGKVYTAPAVKSLPERIEAALNQTPTGKTVSASQQMAPKKAPAAKKTEAPKAAVKKAAPSKSARPVPQPNKPKASGPYGNIAANISAQAKKTKTTDVVKQIKLENPKD